MWSRGDEHGRPRTFGMVAAYAARDNGGAADVYPEPPRGQSRVRFPRDARTTQASAPVTSRLDTTLASANRSWTCGGGWWSDRGEEAGEQQDRDRRERRPPRCGSPRPPAVSSRAPPRSPRAPIRPSHRQPPHERGADGCGNTGAGVGSRADSAQRPRRMPAHQRLLVVQRDRQRRDGLGRAPVAERHGNVAQQAAPLRALDRRALEARGELLPRHRHPLDEPRPVQPLAPGTPPRPPAPRTGSTGRPPGRCVDFRLLDSACYGTSNTSPQPPGVPDGVDRPDTANR
jgi:hypothetical protein